MKNIKKNGFTLIELLAVIVILAVIALIATPIIIGIIEDSRLKANENSAYGIIDSAKYYYAQGLLKPENNIEYNINISEKLTYNGGNPKTGSWVSVNKAGDVGVALLYGNKCYLKEYNEEKIKEGDSKNCEITIPVDPFLLKEELIKENNIVTTGSGLYKMNTTEYRYRGGCSMAADSYTCNENTDNVQNYVKIGQYLYRIIGIDNQGIKVISADEIRKGSFDAGQKNSFDINKTDNIGYYLNKSETQYVIDEVKYIRTIAITADFNGGIVDNRNFSTLDRLLLSENLPKISAKIALINPSDFVLASLNSDCHNNVFGNSNCRFDNWLSSEKPYYTISTHQHRDSNWVWLIKSHLFGSNASDTQGIRPVFYLSADTMSTGGLGTKQKPFLIN